MEVYKHKNETKKEARPIPINNTRKKTIPIHIPESWRSLKSRSPGHRYQDRKSVV